MLNTVYAAYFDHQRRNNPEFRKSFYKQRLENLEEPLKKQKPKSYNTRKESKSRLKKLFHNIGKSATQISTRNFNKGRTCPETVGRS